MSRMNNTCNRTCKISLQKDRIVCGQILDGAMGEDSLVRQGKSWSSSKLNEVMRRAKVNDICCSKVSNTRGKLRRLKKDSWSRSAGARVFWLSSPVRSTELSSTAAIKAASMVFIPKAAMQISVSEATLADSSSMYASLFEVSGLPPIARESNVRRKVTPMTMQIINMLKRKDMIESDPCSPIVNADATDPVRAIVGVGGNSGGGGASGGAEGAINIMRRTLGVCNSMRPRGPNRLEALA